MPLHQKEENTKMLHLQHPIGLSDGTAYAMHAGVKAPRNCPPLHPDEIRLLIFVFDIVTTPNRHYEP